VHDARPRGIGAAGHPPGQRLHERPLRVPLPGMDDHARRLVDHQQVLVLVGHPERRRGDRGLGRLLRLVHAHRLSPGQHVALGPRRAVHGDPPGLDQPLRPGARADRGGQEHIQALAGRLGRHLHRTRSST
jgi:hypothetical protein